MPVYSMKKGGHHAPEPTTNSESGITIHISIEVASALLVVLAIAMVMFILALYALVNKAASAAQHGPGASASEEETLRKAVCEKSPSVVSFRIDSGSGNNNGTATGSSSHGNGGSSSNGNGAAGRASSRSNPAPGSNGSEQDTLSPGSSKLALIRTGSQQGLSSSLSQNSLALLHRQRSSRIEEEGKKKKSSEITRRGQLWSRHASWYLPGAPRIVEHAINQMQGIEQVTAILRKYDVDPHRGFLPAQDPLQRLPYARYHIWEDLADDLPKLLGARLGQARGPLEELPVLSTDKLVIDAELRRAHLLLCLFAHAYVWGGLEPKDSLPMGIAIPLWEISQRLDIPPILSHTSIVLYNWRRLDVHGDICMENLSTLNNFFDGRDESWFYLVTVEIEARGAAAIIPTLLSMDAIQRFHEEQLEASLDSSGAQPRRASMGRSPSLSLSASQDPHQALSCASDDFYGEVEVTSPLPWLKREDSLDTESRDLSDRYVMSGKSMGEEDMDDLALSDALVGELSEERVGSYVAGQLRKVSQAIRGMVESLATMREGCHPFIFYHRVRPFLSGWKHNPTLPDGIIYEGVDGDARKQYYGGSAAQSSLLPFLDITLGVSHDGSKSKDFLMAMRDYMTLPHRKFLEYMQSVQCVRQFVVACLERHNVPLGEGLGGVAVAAGAGTGTVNPASVSTSPEQTQMSAGWVELREAYDSCIEGLKNFRTGHISLVAEYIMAQQRKEGTVKGGIEGTAGGKGTGGTDLMKFLKPIRDDCRDSLLAAPKPDPPLEAPAEEPEPADAGKLSTPYIKDNANFEDIDLYRGGTSISSYSAGTTGYKLPVVGGW